MQRLKITDEAKQPQLSQQPMWRGSKDCPNISIAVPLTSSKGLVNGKHCRLPSREIASADYRLNIFEALAATGHQQPWLQELFE
jgi:hypothetical protein